LATYTPRAGDIVWCRFPERGGFKPAPKPRPTLVISVATNTDPLRLRVAYGTSRHLTPLHPGEFSITLDDGDAYALAGLSYPTKFNLKGNVILPFTPDWFAIPPAKPHGACCKLGSLHPALIQRVRAAAEIAKLI